MTDNSQHDDRGARLKKRSREMVHSLNNTLFIVGGYMELIRMNQQDPELLDNVSRIEHALERSQQILRDWRTDADQIVPDPVADQL